MLPKSNRIVHEKAIKFALRSKFRHKSQNFTLISSRNLTQKNYKSLVIISKKVFKQANLRNKIRRRIASIIYKLQIATSFSIIFQIQNSAIIKQNFLSLETEVQNALSILKVIKPR